MMKIIEEICKGCTILSPERSETWVKHIVGLVYDARQYVNDWEDNDKTKILQNIEDKSQT